MREWLAPGPRLRGLQRSVGSLGSPGRRSVLALLGIMLGSASVIALLNIGRSAAEDTLATFRNMGTDLLVVRFPSTSHRRQMPGTFAAAGLSSALPELASVSAVSRSSARIGYGRVTADAAVVGADEALPSVLDLKLAAGRFMSAYDRRERFAVVGSRVARDLMIEGQSLQVGDLLRIDQEVFEIIGLLAALPFNPLVPVSTDDSVFVPLASHQRLTGSGGIDTLLARTFRGIDPASVSTGLKAQLEKALAGQDVDVQVPSQLLDGMRRQADTFAYLLAGLGGLSLLVGGTGVMNVMLMSVCERRREIGIRMALGARRRDIGRLFLLEATGLCVSGSALGALLGIFVSFVFTLCCGWPLSLSLDSVVLGIGSSMLIGIFSGFYPAWSASRVSPAAALRGD